MPSDSSAVLRKIVAGEAEASFAYADVATVVFADRHPVNPGTFWSFLGDTSVGSPIWTPRPRVASGQLLFWLAQRSRFPAANQSVSTSCCRTER